MMYEPTLPSTSDNPITYMHSLREEDSDDLLAQYRLRNDIDMADKVSNAVQAAKTQMTKPSIKIQYGARLPKC